MQARVTVSPRHYRWVAWSALGVLTLIVFTGAAVRLTGSGLGCPTWPKCTDTAYAAPLESHRGIEFGNRLLTSIVGLPCFLAFVGGWFRKPYRRDLMLLGLGLCLSVVAQAVLGGITVLTGLNPYTVMGHYALSMGALALAGGLVWRVERERAGEPIAVARSRRLVLALRALFAYGMLMIVVGTAASAAGPHAGGEGTGDEVFRLDFKGADTLDFLIKGHARMAAIYGVLAVVGFLAIRRRRQDRDLLRPLGAVCVLLGLQGIVGNLQYHADPALPAEIVWVHVAFAALTFNALVWLLLSAGRPATPPPRPPSAGAAPAPERAATPA
jgi:cytochrome c oxidase assembly protein subunit 15